MMKRKTNTALHSKRIIEVGCPLSKERFVLKASSSFKVCLLLLCLMAGVFSIPSEAQTYEQSIEQGLSAAKEQRYDEAIEHFRQALRHSPNDMRNALTYANIAHIQEVQGKPLKALESYDLALGIAPENLPILQSQTNLYMSMGNQSKAFLGYTKILDINPNDTTALLNRAYIYQQRREYIEAQQDYKRLLTLSPNNYAALLGTAILFQKANKPQEAITRLSRLIEQHPNKAELYAVRAEIEAEAHQPELALMDLDKAIDLEPSNTNLVLTRAYLHLHEGHKHLAQKDFLRAIELGIPRGQLKDELRQCR